MSSRARGRWPCHRCPTTCSSKIRTRLPVTRETILNMSSTSSCQHGHRRRCVCLGTNLFCTFDTVSTPNSGRAMTHEAVATAVHSCTTRSSCGVISWVDGDVRRRARPASVPPSSVKVDAAREYDVTRRHHPCMTLVILFHFRYSCTAVILVVKLVRTVPSHRPRIVRWLGDSSLHERGSQRPGATQL